MTIEKLIAEYTAKVTECDGDILRAQTGMKNSASNEYLFNLHRDDLKVAEAKRQAYFQFTKDLEDLDVAK